MCIRDRPAVDLPPRDPAVDAAAVVADLVALALDRLDQVQVLVALHAAQHDVALRGRVVAERRDRAELPALDLADHAVATRSELYGLALREPRDVSVCPSHGAVSYTHLRAHETPEHLVCRLLLEKKKIKTQ